MFLKVSDVGGTIIHDDQLGPTVWVYDLNVGSHVFTFSGDQNEKKAFDAFQNVNNYKAAIKSLASFLNSQIEKIQSRLNNQAEIVNHNFIETCQHIRDPISEVLPKLKGARNHKEKIRIASEHLTKITPEGVASALLDVDRAITNLQTQIFGLQIISGEYRLQRIEQNLRSMIDSIFAPFDRGLDEKEIYVLNNISDVRASQNLLLLDYHLINWIFYHLLNNAVKYCRPGKELRVHYDFLSKKLVLDMISLKVEDEEASEIFSPGVRGLNAQNEFSGDGLGMYFAKMGLEKMGASVVFIPHNDTCIFLEGKPYSRNEIVISFP